MLAVIQMERLQKRTSLKSTAAVLEAAWITGLNVYRKEFFENCGRFRDEARGKYQRACLFNEESLRLQAAMRVRENAVRKGAPNLVAREFCQWVNNELLSPSDLPPNLPCSIGVRTATRWLRRLGFFPLATKKEHTLMAMSVMTLLPTGRNSLKRWRPSVKRTCLLHLQVTSEQLHLHPMLNSWSS